MLHINQWMKEAELSLYDLLLGTIFTSSGKQDITEDELPHSIAH